MEYGGVSGGLAARDEYRTVKGRVNRMGNEGKALKVGDIVRNKLTGQRGKIKYSTFGVKVAGKDAEGNRWKTNGYAPEYIARYWEVVDDDNE